jgi:GDP-L-fucose synthase
MKILVTGGSGMVGCGIKHVIEMTKDYFNYDEINFIFLSSKDVDLTDRKKTLDFFMYACADYIIHLAANVGGLYKNQENNIKMFSDNIKINENVLEACRINKIMRGIFVLSSCIYPINPSKFPMDESMVHESPPHHSNEGYAYAKRMLEMQCRQHNKLGYEFICLTPVNLYGPYDNFKIKDAHLIPALMHRFHLHNQAGKKLLAYGTGRPERQFLYSIDFAKIILNILLENKDIKSGNIICCTDEEYKIMDVVDKLADVMELDKKSIFWDSTKADGCMKKTVSNEKLKKIIKDYNFIPLSLGLEETYRWFVNNYDTIRK